MTFKIRLDRSAAAVPTAEDLYDATVTAAWKLARCLYDDTDRAADALVRAYGDLCREQPRSLDAARVRLLALVWEQAPRGRGSAPAA